MHGPIAQPRSMILVRRSAHVRNRPRPSQGPTATERANARRRPEWLRARRPRVASLSALVADWPGLTRGPVHERSLLPPISSTSSPGMTPARPAQVGPADSELLLLPAFHCRAAADP